MRGIGDAARPAGARDFVHLADQAHVGGALDDDVGLRDAGGASRRARVGVLQSRSTASIVAAGVGRVQPQRMAAHLLERQRRGQEAERRGGAGCGRDHHLAHAERRARPRAAWAGPAPPKPTMA